MIEIGIAAVMLAAAAQAAAQAPAASPSPAAERRQERAPRETVTALLNGKKVTVEYGRPALGGRKMADLLTQLPADRIWRAGVDQATTFTTETDIIVGGKRVKAGKYTLYVHAPETGDYSLVLNSDLGVPLKTIFPAAPPALADALWPRLGDYGTVAAREVLRVPLRKMAAAEPMDRFLISLAPAKGGNSAITLTWGDQAWTTDIAPTVVPVSRDHLSGPPPVVRAETTFGPATVTVDYGRPALAGRTIPALLSQLGADRMWRAGLHHPTTFRTDEDLLIGGRRLGAGRYTLFVHAPAEGDYELVFNTATSVPDRYAQVKDTEVLRVPMRKAEAGEPLERFVIDFRPAGPDAASLGMAWGDTRFEIDLRPAPAAR